MLDVAAVARELWEAVLSPAAKHRLAHSLGLGVHDAGPWVAFLAGLHDLGKCCPAFTLRPGAESLAPLYADCRPQPVRVDPRAAPHGEVTALTLPAVLERRFGIPPRVARTLAVAVGGHHGVFPSVLRLQELEDATTAVGEGCWRTAREALVDRLASLLDLPRVAPSRIDHAAALMLAGLVTAADWIGSIADPFFPYLVEDLAMIPAIGREYLDRARAQARRALRALRWTGWTPGRHCPTFAAMFAGRQPRPMQQAAIELAERLSGPGLVLIEAPMGEGKTEAALYLADRWALDVGTRGLYLALPTQATSNQMFGRLRDFLAARYPASVVNLQLLHGHADLHADFEELRRRDALVPRLTLDGEDEEPAGVVAGTWFTQRKRGLLAPFGVGTVDQALLAVLRTRHVFVRLYGLSNRVVILDEVHAYDTYMTKLIERLLAWLAALGSPVVVLSATLPRARRDALVRAYVRGLRGRDAAADRLPVMRERHEPEVPAVPYHPYPRMTWVLNRGGDAPPEVGAQPLAVAQPGRMLTIRWLDDRLGPNVGASDALRTLLQAALAEGGCAAVICNTVRRAQEVYRALKPHFPGTASDGLPALDLFHARFLYQERAVREERALARFGPGTERRPDRAVLVATQVIEQSLDLDFDLMVTDFAPVDLLLQRAGRLWRHARPRPARFRGPELWIWRPERGEDGVPRFPGGDGLIYDEHVLFRSWLALRGREAVTLPDDIEELVEAVYGDSHSPAAVRASLSDAERAHWERTLAALTEAQARDEDEAKLRWLPAPEQRVDLWRFTENARAEDEPGFHPAHQALTRLAEPNVLVVFLYGDPHRPALEPGGAPLNLRQKPNAATTRALLARSVTLTSPRGLVYRLLEADLTPSGWQRSPHLRNARLVVLDAAGQAEVAGYRVWLDPQVGICAERRGSGPREGDSE
jgi:CRISPR-associated endonuclease/helicase Cas3